MEKKCCWVLTLFRNFFSTNMGVEYNEAFKKLSRGLIVSNAILLFYDIIYLSYLKISFLSIFLWGGLALNMLSCFVNRNNRTKIAFYIIIVLNLLFFPVNTLLFSIHEAFYFISVLGGIILAVHLPRLYEFVGASVIGVTVFFIERSYLDNLIFPDRILENHPAWFYIRTALMFCVYTYWLYLYKKNQYLHSKIIANKDLSLLKYMTALNQSVASVVITDKYGNIEYANPHTEKATGYQISELLGKNPRIFQSGKTPKDTFSQMWKQLGKGEPWKGTFYNRKKNNEEYIEQAVISPVKNNNGEIINYVAIKEDVTEHLKMVSELQESNAKYFQLTEQTHDVILIIDLKTITISYINAAIEKIQGHKPEEIIGSSLDKLLTEDSYLCMVNDLKAHLQDFTMGSKNVFRNRYQIIHKNQQVKDVEVSAFFIVDHKGNPIEVHSVVRDITKQLQEQRELNQTNQILKNTLNQTTEDYRQLLNQMTNVLNNASNAICFFEVEGEEVFFTSCNERWANAMGYYPEELEGKNISEMLDPYTLSLYRNLLKKSLLNNEPVYEEVYWNNMYLYVNTFPVQERAGKKYYLSFSYNITERKLAEKRLQETEERFYNIFKITNDSIVILTPDLKVEQANESFYKLTNIKEGKQIDNLVNIISYKNIEKLNYNIESLNAEKPFCQFETEILSMTGDVIPVEMNISLITEAQKPLLLCVFRDVSIRKNYEKKLLGSGIKIENRERQKLASDLHDNVGPLLSSLNMCLSLLFRKPEVKKYSDDINDINKMLKDSIIAVREISNNLSPRILVSHGLISALEKFFETKHKLVTINFEYTIGSLRFDDIKESMLYNVIKEVFNNSLKYSQSPEINLKISKRFNYLVIKYEDFGDGFDFDEKLSPASSNLGLFNLINRFKILDGEYRIKTAPGEGFLLNLMFPI
ncbi:PAS domain-containing sensor histidine kinase [Plebeiibacterium sediminum]|uniref:PAS domain S-box protein n=1 Tax=Plebeiibacterium sediminum TaxID=2992112 RepID=A0AAE3M4W0_9BACT|nr:PAS domain S-box protein [Plebeiobacterium sediminum]MCW3787301.1 PAS domain S-box protein [Plebeiobacterium sediminum]